MHSLNLFYYLYKIKNFDIYNIIVCNTHIYIKKYIHLIWLLAFEYLIEYVLC